MRKRWIALLAAVCMVCSPVVTMAEETDYSYLEDMSVKELKALRNAINEILGDEEDVEETESIEVGELTEQEQFALECVKAYTNTLPNSKKFKLLDIWVDWEELACYFKCEKMNSAGADIETNIVMPFILEEGQDWRDAYNFAIGLLGNEIFVEMSNVEYEENVELGEKIHLDSKKIQGCL